MRDSSGTPPALRCTTVTVADDGNGVQFANLIGSGDAGNAVFAGFKACCAHFH